jgi:hypothetical protein
MKSIRGVEGTVCPLAAAQTMILGFVISLNCSRAEGGSQEAVFERELNSSELLQASCTDGTQ